MVADESGVGEYLSVLSFAAEAVSQWRVATNGMRTSFSSCHSRGNHGLLAATKALFYRCSCSSSSSIMLRDKASYCLARPVNFYSSTDYSMCYFFNCNNSPPSSVFVVRLAKASR